ncbi:hypothetical protein ACXWR7_14035, partial [Streptococcus pyogenes]
VLLLNIHCLRPRSPPPSPFLLSFPFFSPPFLPLFFSFPFPLFFSPFSFLLLPPPLFPPFLFPLPSFPPFFFLLSPF